MSVKAFLSASVRVASVAAMKAPTELGCAGVPMNWLRAANKPAIRFSLSTPRKTWSIGLSLSPSLVSASTMATAALALSVR